MRRRNKKPDAKPRAKRATSRPRRRTKRRPSDVPNRITRQSDLARFLHARFRDRIKLAINPPTLDDWRAGLRLKPVFGKGGVPIKPPTFPNKDKSGIGWDVAECIAWVEKWIVPAHERKAGDAPPGEYVDFATTKQSYELRRMKREEDIADGNWRDVAVVNQGLDKLGLDINQAITDHEEGEALSALVARAREIAGITPAQLEQIALAAREVTRASADALRESIVRALLGAKPPAVNGHAKEGAA